MASCSTCRTRDFGIRPVAFTIDPTVIARYPDDAPPRWPSPVLALGNFDGLHRGHMKIIDRVRRRAGERAGTPAAMTFDPHPARVLRPDKAPPLLMTTPQRLEALARAGMQGVAVVQFTRDLSLWDPEMFVRTVLVEWLHVVEVWVGANFLFGHDRAGTYSVLRALGARYGFRAEKIDPVRYKEFVVSSTRIRRLVTEGRVDEAGALLGHHYFIDGTVTRGAGRGREIGFPTANLATDNELLPPSGVYATTATINGVVYPSATNVGTRPTFGDVDRVLIETHLLGVDRDLYGTPVRLSFVQRLRDERAFPDVDALRAQIDADCRAAKRLFDRISL
jgi:riboflavin kinase / FMN adenylyltransferase